jgi:acyl-CoA synthetase (AMP-forming)/AMP-acid ligase II/1-acyl-sn-glycerol-3-phosphate acyltransferase
MITALLLAGARWLLSLRYRVRLSGVEEVARRGTRGILFLPNHPALIDPPILLAHLFGRFAPHALADRDQIDRPILRGLARRLGAYPLPDPKRYGEACRPEVEKVLQRCIAALRAGENVILYPAGHLCGQAHEDLGSASAASTVLQAVPTARVVLVRTRGLWGSSLSRAYGYPDLGRVARRACGALLANGLFFSPRRHVGIELYEPADLPRTADRNTLNRSLEAFYNQDAPPNTYVPYTIWEKGGTRVVPEPAVAALGGDLATVPAGTRTLVLQHLAGLTGRPAESLRDTDRLARDLALDSLALLDLALWLEAEFGLPMAGTAGLSTVGDVLLAACGTMLSVTGSSLRPVPPAWSRSRDHAAAPALPGGTTIPAVFLAQARRGPGRVILADQNSGAYTFRAVVRALLVLQPRLQALPGARLGIMLPASATAGVTTLAALFAGKTPVLLNWTVGTRNFLHCIGLADVSTILTVRPLVQRLEAQGMDFGGVKEHVVYLEDLGGAVPFAAKLWATLRSYVSWRALARARPADIAAILFTSGSENLPKAVPLTHANLLANLRDLTGTVRLRPTDRLIGMLPPFHSFGLNSTLFLPLCYGLPTAYHANPTESAVLARLIEAYGITLLVGTPTFLNGILRAASDTQLRSLRLVVSGAEKCPPYVYETLAERCPQVTVLEGYGITECSPAVALNLESSPRPGTVGRILPSFSYAIQDLESGQRVQPGGKGMLLLRGPCVFSGYLRYEGASPFVEFEGLSWYRTGDLVSESADGTITFAGRLKRFVKLGGEMISLPAIEEVLARAFLSGAEDKPVLAVEGTPQELNPELVLFTTLDIDRAAANRCLREAGLSALYNLRHIVRLDEIPVLGTGKTDYRALRDRLRSMPL